MDSKDTTVIDDGGPAFPVKPYHTDARRWSDGSEGMSLRDYFAGKAMAAMLVQDAYASNWTDANVSKWAYTAADAMIAARKGWAK